MTSHPDLTKWLAGHRPAPAKVVAVLAGGVESPLNVRPGAHRWHSAAKLLIELHAESVRLYDGEGALIGALDLIEPPLVGEAVSPERSGNGPVLKNATDVAVIANAVSDAIVRAIVATSASQAKAHERAFEQLANVAQIATERLMAVEKMAHEHLQRRAEDIDDREAQAEEQQQGAQLQGLMTTLLATAGPELATKAISAIVGGPAPAPAAAPQVTNGAAK